MNIRFKVYFLVAIFISLIGTGCFEPVETEIKSDLAKACTANDIKQFINPQNKSFPKKLDDCASSWAIRGKAEPTTTCLLEKMTGLSTSCASCFGMLAACSAANCMSICGMWNHFGDDCLACVKTHCYHNDKDGVFSLTKCTGLSEDKLPPRKP